MGYGEMYGSLLKAIAEEADAIAMRYFRTGDLRIDRKGDGTAVTQADRAVEEMARAKVATSAPALDTRWWAYRGEGAYRDGRRLRVSEVPSLSKAMVFTTGTGPSKNAEDQAR